jgi:hypothetical protein
MVTKLQMIYWKGDKFWDKNPRTGKNNLSLDIMR